MIKIDTTKIYDCIIIGGGPAGLAAGNILTLADIDFLVIEKGDFLYNRNPNIPSDVVAGIGGGGLFSDGKLSFYPSGSNLYKLNTDLLLKSFQQLTEVLKLFNIDIPAFDYNWVNQVQSYEDRQPVKLKAYKSTVLSQEELYRLGFYLYDQIGKNRFLIKHSVINFSRDGNNYLINLIDNEANINKQLKTKNIIFCGGKFGSTNLASYLDHKDLLFKKFEIGIRVETDHTNFDYKNYDQTDLKLLFTDQENSDFEFRTFCFCRNGYIITGKFEETSSFNGVSNKPNFNKTNFGINFRIKKEETFVNLKNAILELKGSQPIIRQNIQHFLEKDNSKWNKEIYNFFYNCLTTHFPEICKTDAEVTGPSFEYFGYYPKLDRDLKLPNHNLWVCGDSTGDFRGLLPSLVSGYIAAYALTTKEKKEKELLYDLVRLKISSTAKTKVVFTAQSKKFFYCKDAICEFIFNCGYIPVNPFQTFGYFLNDRVDRNLVRRGNNELISRCDELWVFGQIADGVLFEIARAYQLKMPVKFFTMGTSASEIIEITDINKLTFEPEVHAQIGKEKLFRFISQCYNDLDNIIQMKFDF